VNAPPKGWRLIELEALKARGSCSLVGGPFGSDLTQKDYLVEPGVPVIRGSNLDGKNSRFIDDRFVYVSDRKALQLSKNLAFPGDLIFTQRGTLGQVALIPELARFDRYVISQSQMKLTPDADLVDRNYLYHYFRAPRTVEKLLSETQSTGVPHINLGILKRFRVLVPPLAEQRRIAEILDKADALRAKRRAALAQLDTLTQSIFLDMFGDPVRNPKWPVQPLGSLLSSLRYGPRFYNETYADNGVRIVRISDLTESGSLDFASMPKLAVSNAELAKSALKAGDIIFARTGATVGKTAVVRASDPACIAGAYFIVMRFNKSIEPIYARSVLSSASIREIVARRSRQAAQQNFSGPGLRQLPMSLPPISMQRTYAATLDVIDRLSGTQQSSQKEVERLFASLQHRAFRGEL
jgi:type I restriction enzyme, S subunit